MITNNCHFFVTLHCYNLIETIFNHVLHRCGGAGHLRDDILQYKKALEKCNSHDDEARSYLMDMGIKALRLVNTFFPIAKMCMVHYHNVRPMWYLFHMDHLFGPLKPFSASYCHLGG